MWLLILGLTALVYLLINLALPRMFDGFIEVYVVRPILWSALAVSVYFTAKHEELNIWGFKKIRRWEIGETPFHAALLIGGFQISLLVTAGLLMGFGESPYSLTPLSILINAVFVTATLLGLELSRAYLIKKWAAKKGKPVVTLASTALFFMILNIPLMRFTALDIGEPVVLTRFLGETVIPLFAMSLFASYLAYYGGAAASIGYLGSLRVFEWFSPILPDLPWTVNALISTVTPVLGFLIIQSSIRPNRGRMRLQRDSTLSWTGVAVVSVVIVFFSLGFLGVQPTIVYSGSMHPTMDVGDVAIIAKVPAEEIKKGDVILFRSGNTMVIHRVYDVYGEGDAKLFITKGDANDAPDSEPVVPGQVMGKTVFIVPKIGWVPIAVKEALKGLLSVM